MKASSSRGFTTTQAIVTLALTGTLGTAASPQIINFIDDTDRSSLNYARGAFYSAIQTIHMAGLLEKSPHVEVDGKIVTLINGYPLAKEEELSKIIELFGFELEENPNGMVKIWSPARGYCFTYTGPDQNKKNSLADMLSDVASDKDAHCRT